MIGISSNSILSSADAAPSGEVFDQWTGDIASLANANSASTTVTMPAQSISLTATYKASHYTLTVDNGVGDSNTALYLQQIQIAADRQ